MFKLANGWTKKRVLEQVRKYNNGSKSVYSKKSPSSDKPYCAYKNQDGNRCFIGCFIPDGHRGLDEIRGIDTLLRKYPELVSLMPFNGDDALQAFQAEHDGARAESNTHSIAEAFLIREVE